MPRVGRRTISACHLVSLVSRGGSIIWTSRFLARKGVYLLDHRERERSRKAFTRSNKRDLQ
ncbi:hypothetical protein GBA52_015343 [Prunus armeniaca]|nr:hypothetical protein GBA52_015343 [Prunus armeniaca]